MAQSFTFIRKGGDWFIDLPDYLLAGGSEDDLQMVAGADEVLDLLAEQHDSVKLLISETPFTDSDHLRLLEIGDLEEGGAFYQLGRLEGKRLDKMVWLCNVLLFVFGGIPQDIYIKRTN